MTARVCLACRQPWDGDGGLQCWSCRSAPRDGRAGAHQQKPSGGAGAGAREGGFGHQRTTADVAPEKQVERDCDAVLERMGFDVVRFSQPRATKQTPGIPDRYARHARWGIRVWIEYKAGRNDRSPDQVRWHATEAAAGGQVITVWGVADLLVRLREIGAPLDPQG